MSRLLGWGAVLSALLTLAVTLVAAQRVPASSRGAVWVVGGVAVVLLLLLAYGLYARVIRPLQELTDVTRRLAAGDSRARYLASGDDAIARLARRLNAMAQQSQAMVANLRRERARLASVLARMSDGVLITNARGQVDLLNPAAARLLQTDLRSATGQPFPQVVQAHQLITLEEACRASGHEQNEIIEIPSWGLFVHATALPFTDEGAAYCLILLQDLSRIRRLEAVRRDFVSNVSHELRTPLAGLKALVDTLQTGAWDDSEAAQHFLQRMEEELDDLIALVESLLELSRLEAGKAAMRLERVLPEALLRASVARSQPQAQQAGLQLEVRLPEDLPPVLADPQHIRRVLFNLVHNAIKFTPRGGKITLTAFPQGEEVVFVVRDTGVGIAPEELPRIFERFYKSRRSQGSGLGLAIAKHLVQAHGGRLWAESVEGQGSAFYFTLPQGETVAASAAPTDR